MNNLKFWLPVYLYAVFIFVLSAIPELPQIGPDVPNSDKFFHMLEYGIFGLLLARAFKNSSSQFLMGNFLILTCLVSCLYGITDEFHQSFVPGRESNVWDVLFDTIGAFFGCVVWTKKKRL